MTPVSPSMTNCPSGESPTYVRALLLPTSGSSAIKVYTGVPGSADSLIRMASGIARKNGGLSFASVTVMSTSTLADFDSPEQERSKLIYSYCEDNVHSQ